jgi:hypothetical protein
MEVLTFHVADILIWCAVRKSLTEQNYGNRATANTRQYEGDIVRRKQTTRTS